MDAEQGRHSRIILPNFYSYIEVYEILFYLVFNMRRIKEHITCFLVFCFVYSAFNLHANSYAQGFVPPAGDNPNMVESFKEHIGYSSEFSSIRVHKGTRGVGYFQRLMLDRMKRGRFEPVDSVRLLVIRVDFPEKGFDPFHSTDYLGSELRHLCEYYSGASKGRFTLKWQLSDSIVHLEK